jgi:hypothetical protein
LLKNHLPDAFIGYEILKTKISYFKNGGKGIKESNGR